MERSNGKGYLNHRVCYEEIEDSYCKTSKLLRDPNIYLDREAQNILRTPFIMVNDNGNPKAFRSSTFTSLEIMNFKVSKDRDTHE